MNANRLSADGKTLSAYFRSLVEFGGRSALLVLTLTVVCGLLEAVGLLALFPILAAILESEGTRDVAGISSFFDTFGLVTERSKIAAVLGFFVVLVGVRNWLTWLRDTKTSALSLGVMDEWRLRTFHGLAHSEWRELSGRKRTDLEHALTQDIARLVAGTGSFLTIANAAALIIIQMGVLIIVSPAAALAVIVLTIAAVVVLRSTLTFASEIGEETTRAGRKVHNVVGEFFAGLKLAKTHNSEDLFHSEFRDALADLRKQNVAYASNHAATRSWLQFAIAALICGAIAAGYSYFNFDIAVMAIVMIILVRLSGPMVSVLGAVQDIINMLPAVRNLQALEGDSAVNRDPEETATTPPISGPISLELRDVSFRYPDASRSAIESLSLKVEAGDAVLITGRSGLGKTTFLDIVSGLIEPDSGQVVIDGQALNGQDDRRAARNQITYLPQDPFLFDDTIRQNLVWGLDAPGDEQLWAALETAEIASHLREIPDGLDASVGDRGTRFSGGERQRICLARALLRKPGLLILDESLNALDRNLSDRILANLRSDRVNATMLIVSHRPIEDQSLFDRQINFEDVIRS